MNDLVWNGYLKKYVSRDDSDFYSKECPRCDMVYSGYDSHSIEDCIRSLADRVKLALVKDTTP